jgi:hypothetical protein
MLLGPLKNKLRRVELTARMEKWANVHQQISLLVELEDNTQILGPLMHTWDNNIEICFNIM